MGAESYLQRLTTRLIDGLSRLPAQVRERHGAYLRTLQNPDGGFSGRAGGSDLYYTGFALRGLAVLRDLTPEIAERAAGFLHNCLTQQASVIDLFSLLYSCLLIQLHGGPDILADSPADWPERATATLETFRTTDGGYAKSAGAVAGSTYHTYLVGLCYEVLGRSLPRKQEVVRFIQSRRREDGGYVEIAPMRGSGTNPTAAAVGVLQLCAALALASTEERGMIGAFLAAMRSGEGGLQANARAPLADLLSTFTGLWTLEQLGELARLDTSSALSYARALELPSGGFRGGVWDDQSDVEYAFYGLGVLALLS